MDDNTRDFLMWKNGRGRYAEGMQYHGAKTPQEGGVFSSLYSGAVNASRPQAAAYRPHNDTEPVKAEPIPQAEAMTPYAPPRMERIPGESKNAPDDTEAVQGFPEMEPETDPEPVTAEMIFIDQRPAGRRY